MLRTKSLYLKFILILLLAMGITILAGYVAARNLRSTLLRNTARAVAEQVIAFRSWIAGSGVVWVNNLQPNAPDFLGQAGCGAKTFYSKNPALATRELSQIVAQSGLSAAFRVTSDNYRNPKNSPDAFEAAAIHSFKMDLARPERSRSRFFEEFQGSWYRYSVPIIVTKPCLRCHSTPQEAPQEVLEKYGTARGFGYREGDIRGVITVDLPTVSLITTSPATNALSLTLLFAAFAINFILFKRIILNRIVKMTGMTDKIAQGDLDVDIADHYKENSRDEIDKLYHVFDLVRKNMKMIMERMKKP